MSETQTRWIAEVEKEAQLSLNEVKFMLQQGENLLRETISLSEIIVLRTTTLITILSGLLAGLTGFLISKWENSIEVTPLTATLVIALGYLFWITYTLYLNLKGQKYKHIGSAPKEFMQDYFFQSSLKNRELEFYLFMLRDYQAAITVNKEVNEQRWRRFDNSLLYLSLSPILFTLAYVITSIMSL